MTSNTLFNKFKANIFQNLIFKKTETDTDTSKSSAPTPPNNDNTKTLQTH